VASDAGFKPSRSRLWPTRLPCAAWVFEALPKIERAVLRAFRQPAHQPPEMIILGKVSREMPQLYRVSSLVMRAKVYGFCFNWEDGLLKPLPWGRRTEEVITVED
jgi:hypothetical protein